MIRFLKSIIWSIDEKLFKASIKRFYIDIIVEHSYSSYRKNQINYSYKTLYKKSTKSLLNQLCDKYGTDKGGLTNINNPYNWDSHSYADIYELIFMLRRNNIQFLLECGLGTNNPKLLSSMGENAKPGASLRVWKEYFPNARIIGLDIDREILFSEDRIETYYCDQTDEDSIMETLRSLNINKPIIDIIIDDGLHNFNAGKSFFEGTIKFLSINGVYIIEDVTPQDMKLYKNYFLDRTDDYSARFISLDRPGLSIHDNRLIVITKNIL